MERFETQLTKGKRVRLSEREKAVHRQALLHAMRTTPQATPSPFVVVSWITHSMVLRVAALILIVATAGVSTLTYASANSLPGDTLYPIKVHVKEEIEVTLAKTPEAKAKVQTKRIEKRINEVKTLKEKGTLTRAKAEVVKTAIAEHATELKENVTELNGEGKGEVAQNVTKELAVSVALLQDKEQPQADTTTLSMNASEDANAKIIADETPTENPDARVLTINESEDTSIGAFDLENDTASTVDALVSTTVANIDKVTATSEQSIALQKTATTEDKTVIVTTSPSATISTTALATSAIVSDTASATVPATADSTITEDGKILFAINGTVTVTPLCPVEQIGEPCLAPDNIFADKSVIAYNAKSRTKSPAAKSAISKTGQYSLTLPGPGTYRVEVIGFRAINGTASDEVALTSAASIQEHNITIDTGIR